MNNIEDIAVKLDGLSSKARKLCSGEPEKSDNEEHKGDHDPSIHNSTRDSTRLFIGNEEPHSSKPLLKGLLCGLLVVSLVSVLFGKPVDALKTYLGTSRLQLASLESMEVTHSIPVPEKVTPYKAGSRGHLGISIFYDPSDKSFSVTEVIKMRVTQAIREHGYLRRLPALREVFFRGKIYNIHPIYSSMFKSEIAIGEEESDGVGVEAILSDAKGEKRIQVPVGEIVSAIPGEPLITITLKYQIRNATANIDGMSIFDWPLYHSSNYSIEDFRYSFFVPSSSQVKKVELLEASIVQGFDKTKELSLAQSFSEVSNVEKKQSGYRIHNDGRKLTLGEKVVPNMVVRIANSSNFKKEPS